MKIKYLSDKMYIYPLKCFYDYQSISAILLLKIASEILPHHRLHGMRGTLDVFS